MTAYQAFPTIPTIANVIIGISNSNDFRYAFIFSKITSSLFLGALCRLVQVFLLHVKHKHTQLEEKPLNLSTHIQYDEAHVITLSFLVYITEGDLLLVFPISILMDEVVKDEQVSAAGEGSSSYSTPLTEDDNPASSSLHHTRPPPAPPSHEESNEAGELPVNVPALSYLCSQQNEEVAAAVMTSQAIEGPQALSSLPPPQPPAHPPMSPLNFPPPRPEHPMLKASLLSTLFLFWLDPLLWQGSKRPLQVYIYTIDA